MSTSPRLIRADLPVATLRDLLLQPLHPALLQCLDDRFRALATRAWRTVQRAASKYQPGYVVLMLDQIPGCPAGGTTFAPREMIYELLRQQYPEARPVLRHLEQDDPSRIVLVLLTEDGAAALTLTPEDGRLIDLSTGAGHAR